VVEVLMLYFLKTPLGLFNFFIVQWFFIRLQQSVDKDTGEHIEWSILGPVWPLTGWWSDYWWVWRP
jgi:hypothetical protein